MPEPRWTQLRERLEQLERGDLLELLHDLFQRSVENRRFLAARLAEGDKGSALEDYRERIQAAFASFDPPQPPRLGEARKAIRDYRKATSDLDGCADLMLQYVEAGTDYSRQHGDMSEAYYHSLGVVLRDLDKLLRDTPALRASLRPRLEALRQSSRKVGWTWGAYVAEIVDRLAS
jgi:hypothetical protein